MNSNGEHSILIIYAFVFIDLIIFVITYLYVCGISVSYLDISNVLVSMSCCCLCTNLCFILALHGIDISRILTICSVKDNLWDLQVGNFIHYISQFIAGFIIGFVRAWQISLVTLAIVPFIALAGGLSAYVTIGLIANVRKSYVRAGEIAQEVTLSLFLYTSHLFDKLTERNLVSYIMLPYA